MHDHTDKLVEQPDLSRRRFTRAGLSGTVVLGSLASRPVLGQDYYYCTVSGHMSGNISPRPGAVTVCTIGDGPSAWSGKDATLWPSSGSPPIVKGTVPGNGTNQCATSGTLFNGFSANGRTLKSVFFCKQGAFEPSSGQGASDATMFQVLRFDPTTSKLVRLGRATVASLLNAYTVPSYPARVDQIIEMFNDVCQGGTYVYDIGRPGWDIDTVIWYLESLFKSS